jgi:hypothetical protein
MNKCSSSLACGAGALAVDFAENWSCAMSECPFSFMNNTQMTFSLQFPYKNYTLETPVAPLSGDLRFEFQLK